MNEQLRKLLAAKKAKVDVAQQLHNKAVAENRDLTEAEVKQFDGLMAEAKEFDPRIERAQALAAAAGDFTGADLADKTVITGGDDRAAADPKRGFRTFGEFATAVCAAGMPDGQVDQRLRIGAQAPTTYGSEGSGQDGGFQVPPEYAREVFQHSLENGALLPLCDDYPVTGNSLTFPRDETTPWGTDGIRAYWQAEASAATQTKPKGSVATLRLNKLMALVPVTDELQADASALEAYIGRKVADSIRWKTDLAIFEGNGTGQPLGFFGHASQVSVAKEGSQAADTVSAQNVAKMYARMINPGQAAWLINHDVLPQLVTMTLGDQPIWTPPNQGIQGAPQGSLLGRPIIVTQVCKTVGDQGDIVFANLKYYRTITKAGGIQTATSMHLFFDYGLMAFRATFRLDGQPAIAAAVTPANGSNSLSPFVVLDARA